MKPLGVALCAVVLAGCGAAAAPTTAVSPSATRAAPTIPVSPSATRAAPTIPVSPSATPTPFVNATLTVTPGRAPVGATVILDGTGCQNPGQPTYLVFEGEGGAETGTVGAVDIPNVPTDTSGHFHISFTIPAQLHSLQGRGGGLVRPGTYDFTSKPVACLIQFTVTAS